MIFELYNSEKKTFELYNLNFFMQNITLKLCNKYKFFILHSKKNSEYAIYKN